MSENIASSLIDQAPTEKGLKEKWNACLESVKEDISPQGFRTWFSPIIPVNYVEEKLILRVPSQFFFEWIETHYQKILLLAVKQIFGRHSQIEYLVASTPDSKPQTIHLPHHPFESSDGQVKTEPHNVDTRYQFDDFFVKNDNELALRAAQTVAKNPGKTDFNPLFIYGGDGCGKTHLLNAVGSFTLRSKDPKNVTYLSSEHFLNQYVYALQNKKLDSFKKKYKNTDILLLDDIQFLSHKKKSQEGLFFFFSELERKRKQIVITANQSPAQLVGLDQRLISFFQKGLILDLIPPSYETRLKYIKFFCVKSGLNILPEVREFLARSLTEGMQQLRAVMVRISAQSSLLGEPMKLNATKRLLTQIDLNWAQRHRKFSQFQQIKIEDILKTVSEYLNMPCDLITGYSRQREVSFARQVAIYLAKELSGESLRVIGYHFKDRHYTAILHNYKKIKSEMKSNPAIHNLISELKIKLIQT